MATVLVDETLPLRPRVHNDPSAAPWGMLDYDRGALSSSQQEGLNHLKTSLLRKGNRRYLMAHPQVTAVVSVILRAVYLHRPSDPKTFIAGLVGRSDFEDRVHHYLLRNGPSRQSKQDNEKDLYLCIHPELLVRKQTNVYREKMGICLDIPDGDMDSVKEYTYPTDSSSSVDSLKMFSAIGAEAMKLEKKLNETYRRTEEAARKAVRNNLILKIEKESTLQTELAEEEDQQPFPEEP